MPSSSFYHFVPRLAFGLLTTVGLSAAAQAQDTAPMPATSAAASAASAPASASTLSDGEIRKINLDAGKLTLRHGELKNLNMPPMTMVFVVKDKTLLNELKVGDKIRFHVIMEAGQMVITRIEPAL